MEQFEIYSLPLFSLVLTNVTFYLMVALAIIIGISRLSDHKLVGNWWTLLNESLYHTLLQMTRENVGTNATNYFPLLFTVFYLILFSNLIGLVPYTSTPTVEMVLALSLAVTLLIGVLITGFLIHGQKLFAAFIPAGTPLGLVPLMILLEILAYLTRTLSLGLRLAVNMTTGHILAKVMIGFIWAIALSANFISTIMFALAMSLITLFIGLEILIAYLQATIFVFITCITFKDMTNNPSNVTCISLGLSLFVGWNSLLGYQSLQEEFQNMMDSTGYDSSTFDLDGSASGLALGVLAMGDDSYSVILSGWCLSYCSTLYPCCLLCGVVLWANLSFLINWHCHRCCDS